MARPISKSQSKANKFIHSTAQTHKHTNANTHTHLVAHDVCEQHQVAFVHKQTVTGHRIANLSDNRASCGLNAESPLDLHDVIARGELALREKRQQQRRVKREQKEAEREKRTERAETEQR